MPKRGRQEEKTYILMPVTHYEAAEGAYGDVYRPLTKKEAKQKIQIKLLWLLLVFACIVFGITFTVGRALWETRKQATVTGHPPLRVLSVHYCLGEASQLAQQWRSNAELVQIRARVIGPKQDNPRNLKFFFVSPNNDQQVYLVSWSPDGCSGEELEGREIIEITGHDAIEFNESMIDSKEAAYIGYQNGGDKFAYHTDANMWVKLTKNRQGAIDSEVWIAHFESTVGTPVEIVIDPYTGQVIRTE